MRSLGERAAFLDALFAFAGELDRRPAFYQMSLDWLPALHDRGYVSIGCEPCTRASRPGEHERASRWWWEEATKRECGLHTSK